MNWTEMLIEVPPKLADALSDAFVEAGALSVSVEDADEGTAHEQPIFDEPGLSDGRKSWVRNRLVILVESESQIEDMVDYVTSVCELGQAPAYTTREVADCDWVRLTQSQFEPMKIGKNIWVVPSWHAAPEPDALVLELDPGLAFGTGSHPTTRLCMEWLEAVVQPGQCVLDYGCGSGILAMVAAKRGAGEVFGIDIDRQAIVAADDNASRNDCGCTFMLPDAFDAAKTGQFDIVVANILTEPLKLLAPLLCGQLRSGGRLCLSGVLARQAQDVIVSYAPYIALHVHEEHDGWVALTGVLKPDN